MIVRRAAMVLVAVASALVLTVSGVLWATDCLADTSYPGSTP